MIHLEILELNFCGLNKYTKRNIEERSDEDVAFEGRDSTVSLNVLELNKDYYLENIEEDEKNIEMNDFSYIKSSPIKLEFKSGLCKGYENKEFLSNYYNQYIFTTISIGSNNQKIDLALKLNRYITYITGSGNTQLKSEIFNEKNSETYKKLEEKETDSHEDEFFISYKSKDNIKLCNTLGENITTRFWITLYSHKYKILFFLL